MDNQTDLKAERVTSHSDSLKEADSVGGVQASNGRLNNLRSPALSEDQNRRLDLWIFEKSEDGFARDPEERQKMIRQFVRSERQYPLGTEPYSTAIQIASAQATSDHGGNTGADRLALRGTRKKKLRDPSDDERVLSAIEEADRNGRRNRYLYQEPTELQTISSKEDSDKLVALAHRYDIQDAEETQSARLAERTPDGEPTQVGDVETLKSSTKKVRFVLSFENSRSSSMCSERAM